MGFFSKLQGGLSKTRDNIVKGIDNVFNGYSDIDEDFYDELEEIIVMQYLKRYHAVLFRCKWFNTDPRKELLKVVQNIRSVYVNAEWYNNDRFVLCTQAQKVFY